MTFGLRCSGPAGRPRPASLPVRVPTVEGLPSASFGFTSRLGLAVRLRLPSSAPIGSFHPTRFCPCWAHSAAGYHPAPQNYSFGAHTIPWDLRVTRSQQPKSRKPAPVVAPPEFLSPSRPP